MKFLKAVLLDDSDSRVFGSGGAAQAGEWVVSGGYAVSLDSDRAPSHRDNTFIGIASQGRCTIAEVSDIEAATYQNLVDQLARHFLDARGAPSLEAARAAAEDECTYTADLCESFSEDVWITVRREATPEGVGEHYSVFRRLMIGAHRL